MQSDSGDGGEDDADDECIEPACDETDEPQRAQYAANSL